VLGLFGLSRWDALQGMAEVRPRLAAFTAEMAGDVPRKDQRARASCFARR